MKNRFLPPQGEGKLRLLFINCKQEDNQELQTFYTKLLAKGAKEFQGESVDSMERNLIDQFIVGTKEEKIRLH